MQLLIPLSLFLASWWAPYEDHWWGTWWVVLGISVVFISLAISKKTHPSIGLAVLSSLMSALYVFMDKTLYSELGPSTAMAMDNVSMGSYLSFITLLFLFYMASRRHLDILEDCFAYLCMINSVYTLATAYLGSDQMGLFGNASMNGMMIVATYPLLVMRPERNLYYNKSLRDLTNYSYTILKDLACILIPILAVAFSKAHVPIFGMALFWVLFLFFQFQLRIKTSSLISILISVTGFFVISIHYLSSDAFHDNGRFEMWKMAFKGWDRFNPLFGSGQGTAFMWIPSFQEDSGLNQNNWFIWMHNDWLQILFEQGILGFGLAVIAYGFVISRSFQRPYLVTSVLLYGAMALFNFPMHLAVHSVLGLFLVARSYDSV